MSSKKNLSIVRTPGIAEGATQMHGVLRFAQDDRPFLQAALIGNF